MDDYDRPHRLTRDLEDIDDVEGSAIFDTRALDDEADPSPTHAEPDEGSNASEGRGDPEPREASMAPAYGMPGVSETWPQRQGRAMPAHERRPLPARMRGRGVACVVVMFNDGRKVVLR